MAPKKNWFVMDWPRMHFVRDMRFFRVILLLLLVALGIRCTTSMPGWTTRAKGWMEEQICGSAIERKIRSDYQALLAAQTQNTRRLLQEVAQLRVELISTRKASDGRWYKMDDDKVVLCDIQVVLDQRAYLLFYVRHHDLTAGAGTECQGTKSTGVAKSVQEPQSPLSEGCVAPRKPEGAANTQRIQRSGSPRDSAAPRPQRRGRKRRHSAAEEGEKPDGSHPDCPPPKRRRTGPVGTQERAPRQRRRGSGILRRSSHRDRNSSAYGRSSIWEGLYGSSGHRADSHPGARGEQQPGKHSLGKQGALPPVPVQPEAANKKPPCRKRKRTCAEEDESAPARKRRRIEESLLVIQP